MVINGGNIYGMGGRVSKRDLQTLFRRSQSRKALEIVNKIIDRAETLEKYPKRGRIEEDLRVLGKGHRYLLEYHYKIIYKAEGETVTITDIFSNRQDPARKQERNK